MPDPDQPLARSGEAAACALPIMSFADILAPVTVDEFRACYFQKRALHVQGARTRFKDLLDRTAFQRCLAAGPRALPHLWHVRASFQRGPGSREGCRASEEQISAARALAVLDAGGTVCVSNLHLAAPQLLRVAADAHRALGCRGTAGFHAYLSSAGFGYDLHLDSRVACTLQLEGKKTWWFEQRPSLPVAPCNVIWRGGVAVAASDDAEIQRAIRAIAPPAWLDSVLLEPGDLLCLPAGTWHAAQAAEGSLALNLFFEGEDEA